MTLPPEKWKAELSQVAGNTEIAYGWRVPDLGLCPNGKCPGQSHFTKRFLGLPIFRGWLQGSLMFEGYDTWGLIHSSRLVLAPENTINSRERYMV